jgi:hypothetical protein
VIDLLMNMACNHQLLPKEGDGTPMSLQCFPFFLILHSLSFSLAIDINAPVDVVGSGLPLFASPNPDEIALVTGAYYSMNLFENSRLIFYFLNAF